MSPNEAPFSGKYPSLDEARRALAMFGYADDAKTEVFVPFDNSKRTLEGAVAACETRHLTIEWPIRFRAYVDFVLSQAQKG